MSFSAKNQCIHCDVESCQHHEQEGLCELETIKVEPRCGCHTGDCDESLCSSYRRK